MESVAVYLGHLEITEDFVPVNTRCHVFVPMGVLRGTELELPIDEHKHEVVIDVVLLNRPDDGALRQTNLPTDQKVEAGSRADAAAWPLGIPPKALELICVKDGHDVILGLLEEIHERTSPMLIGQGVVRKLTIEPRLLKHVECLYFLALVFREQRYIQGTCLQCSILSLS